MDARGLSRQLHWTSATVAAALVVLAAGQAATAKSNGVLSDRVMYAGQHNRGHWAVQGLLLGTGNVVTVTPRWAPPTLFEGAEVPSYYDYAQFNPETFGVSPDGNTVAFATAGDECCTRLLDGELFAINADNSGLRRLTRTEKLNETDPVFSPDGKLIAYLQDTNLNDTAPRISLAVMNADGTGQRTLARTVVASGLIASASDLVISWNRDSRRILFTSNPGVNERTLLIDLASGTIRPISGSRAEFSPNGRELAIWYHGQVYAGTPERLAKPGYWRTLRPRAAIQRRGGAPFKGPYDFVWRPDGRILFTMSHLREGPREGCRVRSDIGLSSPVGTKWLAQNICGAGKFIPSPAGDEAIWLAGQGRSGGVLVSPTARWKPRPGPAICFAIRCSWGYQPTKRSNSY